MASELSAERRGWIREGKTGIRSELANSILDALEAAEAKLKVAEEGLREFTLPPYPDSDLASLYETMQKRATALLAPEVK